jgi:hypothetical protein
MRSLLFVGRQRTRRPSGIKTRDALLLFRIRKEVSSFWLTGAA